MLRTTCEPAQPMPVPLPLRPYTPLRMVLTVCGRCFSEDPDRDIDYETDILQGNLVSMDGAVYLRRICRRGCSLCTTRTTPWRDGATCGGNSRGRATS